MKIQISKWLIVIATFVSLMFVVTGLEAGKPDNPKKTKAECILFTGDLLGMAEVEGCCPNAGPWPAYTMTFEDTEYDGEYDGQLFMNFAGDQGYKVQFWSWDSDTETPVDGDIFFEIYGGDIVYVRKTKFLTVTFTGEEATLWEYYNSGDPSETQLSVSFKLERTSNLTYCE